MVKLYMLSMYISSQKIRTADTVSYSVIAAHSEIEDLAGMLEIMNQASKIFGSGDEFRSFEEAFMSGKLTTFEVYDPRNKFSVLFSGQMLSWWCQMAVIGANQVYRLYAAVPDLETIPTRVLARGNGYEIREVQVSGDTPVLRQS